MWVCTNPTSTGFLFSASQFNEASILPFLFKYRFGNFPANRAFFHQSQQLRQGRRRNPAGGDACLGLFQFPHQFAHDPVARGLGVAGAIVLVVLWLVGRHFSVP